MEKGNYPPGPYVIGQPGGPSGPFWSLVNSQGNVIAMQILSEEAAQLFKAAPALLDACRRAFQGFNNILELQLMPGYEEDVEAQVKKLYEAISAVEGVEVALDGPAPETYPEEADWGGEYDEMDEWEQLLTECGMTRAGYCTLSGTEHCDFECPFRDMEMDWLLDEEE